MEKTLRSDWFLLELQAEIAKLKDIEILSSAESIEILFNCPRKRLKDIFDALNAMNLGQPGSMFNLEEYILREYDAVLVFPIKNDEPVIVFKKFGSGLSQLRVCIDVPLFDSPIPFSATYRISWKGKILTDWPRVFKKQYSKEYIGALITVPFLKSGVGVELPLKMLIDGTNLEIFSGRFITSIKNALRKLNLLTEKRGKQKNKDFEIRKMREKFLISNYKKLGSPSRLPIKELQSLWMNKIDALLCTEKAEKYYCDDMTVRRILNKFIKENKTRKELKELVKGITPYDQDKIRKEVEKDMQTDPRFADWRRLVKANIKK